jgi:WS/DGAT/MGAT family acyltransferase
VQPWEPRPEPSELALVADAFWANAMQPLKFASSLPNLLSTVRKAPQMLDYAGGLARQLSRFTQSSASALNGPIGPHRRWCWQRASLDDVKVIRKAFGGTVNDVVLAAVTRGFRDQLSGRGVLEPGMIVRSGVPVSVRASHQKGSLDNRVSAVFVNLPVGEEDPLRRLELIREQMDDLKGTNQEVGGAQITRLTDAAVAPALMVLSARLPIRLFNPIVQTVTTNVPGPQFPIYILGSKVQEMYPYVPLTGGIQIATAIFSYLGHLSFGISADFDGQPDADIMSKGLRAGFDELLSLAGKDG